MNGNPVFKKKGYAKFIVKNAPKLQMLDAFKITREIHLNAGLTEMDEFNHKQSAQENEVKQKKHKV